MLTRPLTGFLLPGCAPRFSGLRASVALIPGGAHIIEAAQARALHSVRDAGGRGREGALLGPNSRVGNPSHSRVTSELATPPATYVAYHQLLMKQMKARLASEPGPLRGVGSAVSDSRKE